MFLTMRAWRSRVIAFLSGGAGGQIFKMEVQRQGTDLSTRKSSRFPKAAFYIQHMIIAA
jgi:hypothetical protein